MHGLITLGGVYSWPGNFENVASIEETMQYHVWSDAFNDL